jgi:hypothetical protein
MRSIVLLMASLSMACADSGSDERSPLGRGTEACRIWQDAACDHFADECEAIDRATCDAQYQSVTCRSDAVAKSCTKKLQSADCGEATADCLIDGVATPEPAMNACHMLVEKFCELNTMCNMSNMDSCVASSSTQIDCDKAIGFRLDFEKCLDALDQAECDTKLALPVVCRDVILVRQ